MASGNKITTTGVLYINGVQVENTFTNISKLTKKLEGELRKLPVGTKEFIEKAEQVKQARARFQEVRNEINAVTSALDKTSGSLGFFKNGLLKVGDTMREVFTANLFERALDAIINKGKMTVDQLLKIADAMTDVQKTSGMSLEQVKELWDQFDEMDTRTSKMDRLKIAEVAGRLGVPIGEMKSFVQEVDKAYVALGDSFEGGLEGVVDQLGKIKGLFEQTKGMSYAESINRVGSALNTLAASGTSSEGNISQFTLRIGSLPDALKPAIDKVLGLGAAFEEAGIDAQIASSGTSNFLTTAAENIEAFAYSMHMSVAEAKELINTKPEEFLLRFAEGMKNVPADETAKIFASLKLNSLEVQKVIGAAANKTDDFRRAMKTAGEEMDKMTSLQGEFNQKNNNAPAILEKIKNAWNDIFTSTNVINKFEWLIKAVGWLTGVTSEASDGIIVFKERLVFLGKIITILIASVLGYNAAMAVLALTTKNAYQQTLLYNIVQKAKIVWDTVARGTTLLYAAAQALLAGNTTRATAAMRAFSIATKANPIGLLVAVLTAAVTAFVLFSEKVDESTRKQKLLNSVMKEAKESIAKEVAQVQQLVAIAQNENIAREKRLEAIKKLNQISPEMLGNLTLENIKTQEATNAINQYIKALERKATAEAFQSKRTELIKKKIEEQSKTSDDYADWTTGGQAGNKIGFWLNDTFRSGDKLIRNIDFNYWDKLNKKQKDELWNKLMPSLQQALIDRSKNLNDINNDIKTLNDQEKSYLEQNPDAVSAVTSTSPTNIAAPEKTKKNREAEIAAKKSADDLEKSKDAYNKAIEAKTEADKKMLDLQRAYEDEKNKILEESRQKAEDDENRDFERRKQDLRQQNKEIENQISKSETEIQKLQRDKKETKSPEAAKNFDAAISQLEEVNRKRQKLILKNYEIEKQLEQTHQFNLLKIKEHWTAVDFEKFVKNEQRKIDESRRNDEEEITNIDSLAEAKAKLKEQTDLKLTDQELRGINNLEDAKAALREAADRRMLKAQQVSLETQIAMLREALNDPALSNEAREKLAENLDFLKDKITQLKSAIKSGEDADNKEVTEEQESAKEKVDILGFSAKDWEDTFTNIDSLQDALKATAMVFQALGNAGQMFSQLQQALGEKELRHFNSIQDKKKKSLLKQLNEGYITREDYVKATEKLEAEAANKKAELEYKQAKADKIAKIFSAIGNTAMGVTNALASAPPPANFALAALVGALGAVQIGIIAAQPLPERPSFAVGGFGKDGFEGFTGSGFGSPDETGEKKARLSWLHEKEWVAPRWMTQHPKHAKVIDYLESVRQGKSTPSYADGGFSSDPIVTPSKNDPDIDNDLLVQYIAVMSEVKNLLQKLDEEGVEAFIGDNANNGRKIQRMIKNWNNLESKNKH